jgi:hypothetical protein
MISTDVMISATIRCPPDATSLRPPGACNSASLCIDTRNPPPASCLPVPGACNSASLWTEHTGAYIGAIRSVLESDSEVYLGTYSEVFLGVS